MYYLNGITENLETFLTLTHPFRTSAGEGSSWKSSKEAYYRFLSHYQPRIAQPKDQDEPVFESDPNKIAGFLRAFNETSALTDLDYRVDQKSAAYMTGRLATAKIMLANLRMMNPELHGLFQIAVNTIFAAKSGSAGGGTTSSAIGVIWMDQRQSWTEQDFMEFFVHELGHTLMFLDELRHRHYTNLKAAIAPETYCLSAILCIPRPLDKVLHSLVVATEVLGYREQTLTHVAERKLHPDSKKMLVQALRCAESIEKSAPAQAILTERGKALVRKCKERLLEMAGFGDEIGKAAC